MMWTSCALITFAPAFGFGIFCDEKAKKCERYRDAKEPLDVAYAFLCFLVGSLSFSFKVSFYIEAIFRSQELHFALLWSCAISQ